MNAKLPIDMEMEIIEKLPHCDLVFYPLSPSIAVPAVTSMLPPDHETLDYGRNDESYLEAMQSNLLYYYYYYFYLYYITIYKIIANY